MGYYGILGDLWSYDFNIQAWRLQQNYMGISDAALYSFYYTSFEYNSNFYLCITSGFAYDNSLNFNVYL